MSIVEKPLTLHQLMALADTYAHEKQFGPLPELSWKMAREELKKGLSEALAPPTVSEDTARLDWLEKKNVSVGEFPNHGTMYCAGTYDLKGTKLPSDIRTRIDFARASADWK